MNTVIRNYALNFISFYTKGLSHRLLRTPIDKRDGQSVNQFLTLSKQYADRLVEGNEFNPEKPFSIKLAKKLMKMQFFVKCFYFLRR